MAASPLAATVVTAILRYDFCAAKPLSPRCSRLQVLVDIWHLVMAPFSGLVFCDLSVAILVLGGPSYREFTRTLLPARSLLISVILC